MAGFFKKDNFLPFSIELVQLGMNSSALTKNVNEYRFFGKLKAT